MSDEPGDVPWIDAPHMDGEIDIRFRRVHSHALSFEFMGDDGDTEIEGAVKWDGCVNWSTSDDGAYHFCDPTDAERLSRAFNRAWRLAAEHLPTWDADIKLSD